jgi:starch phosphorylase
VGWAIGGEEQFEDQNIQDSVESKSIYDILERSAEPLFYDRGQDGLPRGWISKMKSSLGKLNASFNTNRMLRDYTEQFYLPLALRWQSGVESDPSIIKAFAKWKHELEANWKKIKVTSVTSQNGDVYKVGGKKQITAIVSMDGLAPDDVQLECYYGQMDNLGEIRDGQSAIMEFIGSEKDNQCKFIGNIPCDNAGLFGYAVRVLPNHEHLVHKWIPGLITWG